MIARVLRWWRLRGSATYELVHRSGEDICLPSPGIVFIVDARGRAWWKVDR